MSKPITLRIDDPCTESWDSMSLQTEGRQCASCQKIVQDFTQFSDAELVTWFEQSSERTCGRLRADQVDKVLRVNTAEQSGLSWLRWVVALVVSWQSVKGQSAPSGHKLSSSKPPATIAPTKLAAQQAQPQRVAEADPVVFTISGRVTDVYKASIQGVNVLFKSTTHGCITDKAGVFTLAVKRSDQTQQTRQLVFSFMGYTPVELTVPTRKPPTRNLSVQLMENNMLLGEVICVPEKKRGDTKRTSYKWR